MSTLPLDSRSGVRHAWPSLIALAERRFAVKVRFASEVVAFGQYTMGRLALPVLLGVVNIGGLYISQAATQQPLRGAESVAPPMQSIQAVADEAEPGVDGARRTVDELARCAEKPTASLARVKLAAQGLRMARILL
jgi:hypothetical protein